MSAPIPDPSTALALAAAHYWIVPLNGHRKHPDRIGSKTHGEILRAGDRDYLTAHVLTTAQTATGWALIPQPGDPDPLVILDLDRYDLPDAASAWAQIADAEPLPPGAPAVRSASGGWHFYFRLPAQGVADRLPGTWDFGGGRKGDIRASRASPQLIVLPGSVCLGKSSALGYYALAQGNIVPTGELPLFPESLQIRLVNRNGGASPEKAAAATEAQHLLALLHFISEIPPGAQNGAAAKIGQVLGRIGPADQPSGELVSLAWDVFRDRAHGAPGAEPWTFSAFEKHLKSGYKTGRRNAQKHAPRDKSPAVDDVKAEVIAIFGGWPALTEIVNHQGKVAEWVLSFEGRQVHLASLDNIDVVTTLTRLFPAVDKNAVSQSPVFTMPGWGRAALYALKAEGTTDRLGNDPEALFWEMLDAAAEDAADAGKFLTTWGESRAALGNPAAFLVAPAGADAWLVLSSAYEARFYARCGSASEVNRLMKQNLLPKALTGMKGGGKIHTVAVNRLSESAQAIVRKGYERWVAARLEESKHENESHP